jgi:hypothetical protein
MKFIQYMFWNKYLGFFTIITLIIFVMLLCFDFIKQAMTYGYFFQDKEFVYEYKTKNFISADDTIDYKFTQTPHLPEIKGIIVNDIGISENDDELNKTIKIGRFIFEKTKKLRGIPVVDYKTDYYYLWKKVESKEAVVACRELSVLYALFANNAGVNTRVVNIRNLSRNNEEYYHTVAESFHSIQKKWYIVDLTYDQEYVIGENGKLLNVFEYADLIKNNHFMGSLIMRDTGFYKYGSYKDSSYEQRLVNQSRYYDGMVSISYNLKKYIDLSN